MGRGTGAGPPAGCGSEEALPESRPPAHVLIESDRPKPSGSIHSTALSRDVARKNRRPPAFPTYPRAGIDPPEFPSLPIRDTSRCPTRGSRIPSTRPNVPAAGRSSQRGVGSCPTAMWQNNAWIGTPTRVVQSSDDENPCHSVERVPLVGRRTTEVHDGRRGRGSGPPGRIEMHPGPGRGCWARVGSFAMTGSR